MLKVSLVVVGILCLGSMAYFCYLPTSADPVPEVVSKMHVSKDNSAIAAVVALCASFFLFLGAVFVPNEEKIILSS